MNDTMRTLMDEIVRVTKMDELQAQAYFDAVKNQSINELTYVGGTVSTEAVDTRIEGRLKDRLERLRVEQRLKRE